MFSEINFFPDSLVSTLQFFGMVPVQSGTTTTFSGGANQELRHIESGLRFQLWNWGILYTILTFTIIDPFRFQFRTPGSFHTWDPVPLVFGAPNALSANFSRVGSHPIALRSTTAFTQQRKIKKDNVNVYMTQHKKDLTHFFPGQTRWVLEGFWGNKWNHKGTMLKV